jgi:hypothetical protein
MYLPKFSKLWMEAYMRKLMVVGKCGGVFATFYGKVKSAISLLQLVIQFRLH